jgi:hypothetical protein
MKFDKRQQQSGRRGQGLLLALEDHHEAGEHEGEQEDGGADGEGTDDAGIDHRALDHRRRLDLVGEVAGDAVEHLGEAAGQFRGLHHVDVEGAEVLRVAHQRVGELLTALDVLLHLQEHGLELGVRGLLADALDGRAQADARADHDGQLAGEVLDVAGAGAEGSS